MSAPSGEEVAAILLRVVPADVAEQLLSRLGDEPAQRLRARLQTPNPPKVPPDHLQVALQEFFDLHRIADRVPLNAPPAGEYTAVATKPDPEPEKVTDPIRALQQIEISKLIRVLSEEQAPAVSLIMSTMETSVATEIMKRLPSKMRPDVALRLTQPAPANRAMLEQLAWAVIAKSEVLKDVAPELTSEDRVVNLATILRALPRVERKEIMEALNIADVDSATRVGALLFQFDDLLRVDDRGLQTILVELDMKTLAMALKGASDTLVNKVTSNISSRARDMLNEEVSLLGTLPSSRVQEARTKIVELLRHFEEEGKLTLGEE